MFPKALAHAKAWFSKGVDSVAKNATRNLWEVQELRCGECNDVVQDGCRCLNCKRNHYFERKGEITDYCKTCVVIKPLLTNGECRRCAAAAGLRECGKCRVVLPQLLSFNKKQGQCAECRRELRRVRRTRNRGGRGRAFA